MDGRPLILSSLNDYLYCPRRLRAPSAGGNLGKPNAHTVAGDIGPRRLPMIPGIARRHRGRGIERALPLFSLRLNLNREGGHRWNSAPAQGNFLLWPVGSGKGRRGAIARGLQGEVRGASGTMTMFQLCAQALCLEEMFGTPVPCGAVLPCQKRAGGARWNLRRPLRALDAANNRRCAATAGG